MNDSINEAINELKILQKMKWKDITAEINERFDVNLSMDAVKSRYRRSKGSNDLPKNKLPDVSIASLSEVDEIKYDGSRYKQTRVPESMIKKIEGCRGNKNKIIEVLGYNSEEWELLKLRTSRWEQKGKEEKILHSLQYQIKPVKLQDISLREKIEIAKEVLSKEIKPLPKSKQKCIPSDKDKMMEVTGIELHLGKLAYKEDVGKDYNWKIAKDRFNTIINEIVDYQSYHKCDTCFLCIGNDFFNYDNVQGATTKGTVQDNDLTYRLLFKLGMELYVSAIDLLSKHFNRLDIRLQSGNHDTMTVYHLYIALMYAFKKYKNVYFGEDWKVVQHYVWGDNAIFFTHGGKNVKRLINALPQQFYKVWGETKYHELHLGHFHHELQTKEENGLIVRQVSSPSGVDNWHYEEHMNTALQKYQVFVWDKKAGLTDIKNIIF